MQRSTIIRMTFAILAIAFFAGPLALRAVGVKATAFENRKFAEAPRLSQGWNAFDQTTRFFTDRLPLREKAVHANNDLWDTFFGETPRYGTATADGRALPFAGNQDAAAPEGAETPGGQAAQVLPGLDGWLYIKDELTTACTPTIPVPEAVKRWERLVSIVRASGRRAILLVPPDKGSVYGEHLPPGALTLCARRAKSEFWRTLAAEPRSAGVVPLQQALSARKQRTKERLYSRYETHWTTGGSIEMVRAALDRLGGPVQVKQSEIKDGKPDRIVGDLSTLQGKPAKDYRPTQNIVRPLGAPSREEKTLFLNDSFGDVAYPALRAYFTKIHKLPWVGSTQGRLIRGIAGADTVVFETVERAFDVRASENGPLGKHFLDRLERRLSR